MAPHTATVTGSTNRLLVGSDLARPNLFLVEGAYGIALE